MLPLGPQFPCVNKSASALSRWDIVYPYAVRHTIEGNDESPLELWVTTDADTIYGPVTSRGLWPWPRVSGIIANDIAVNGRGAVTLDTQPQLAKVYSDHAYAIDLLDTDDIRTLQPLVSTLAEAELQTWLTMTASRTIAADDRIPEGPATYFHPYDNNVGFGRITNLWHNLGAIEERDDDHWLCLVAKVGWPSLRGVTASTSPQFGHADIWLCSALETHNQNVEPETMAYSDWGLTLVMNDFATVAVERMVNVSFRDGWWHLTAGEC